MECNVNFVFYYIDIFAIIVHPYLRPYDMLINDNFYTLSHKTIVIFSPR